MEGLLFQTVSGNFGVNYSNYCSGKDFTGSRIFSNNDHRLYYSNKSSISKSMAVRCGNESGLVVIEKGNCDKKNDNKKMIKKQKMMIKKRSKLLKGLSRDFIAASGLGEEGLQFQEASEALVSQLKQLRSEHKELKKKIKEDKTKLKAPADCSSTSSSSSSSSESSDSECEREVLDMSHLKHQTIAPPPSSITINQGCLQHDEQQEEIGTATAVLEKYTMPKSQHECDASLLQLLEEAKEKEETKDRKKIEVCMGGKCKKSGAGALLEEFQKAVAAADEVDVVGCKCMGKCRDGPNVRLVSSSDAAAAASFPDPPNIGYDEHQNHKHVALAAVTSSVLTRSKRTLRPSHPLCIGVGLEDVGFIVSKVVGDRLPQ